MIVAHVSTPVLNVLGPFALAGHPSEGRLSPRQRSIVSALVLGEGLEVEAATIINLVWGEDPPPTVRKAIQVHMVAIRNVLGAERIATTPGGYRLVAERHEVDLWQFERLVRSALHSAEPSSEGLAEALRLWRGTPLPDLDAHVAVGVRVRLEELRAVAIELRTEQLMASGAVGEAVRILGPAALDDPLRERRWALLMVALYRGGRRAESLRAFQQARDSLAEAAGLEPGRLLRAIERLVLHDDPRLWLLDILDDPDTMADLGTIGLGERELATAAR